MKCATKQRGAVKETTLPSKSGLARVTCFFEKHSKFQGIVPHSIGI